MAPNRNMLMLFALLVLVLALGAAWWFKSPPSSSPAEDDVPFPTVENPPASLPAAPLAAADAGPTSSLYEIDGTLLPEHVEQVLGVLEPLVEECVTDHRAQFSRTDGGGVGYRFRLESQAGKTTLSGLQLEGIRSLSPWVDACLADLKDEAPLPALAKDGKATVVRHLQP